VFSGAQTFQSNDLYSALMDADGGMGSAVGVENQRPCSRVVTHGGSFRRLRNIDCSNRGCQVEGKSRACRRLGDSTAKKFGGRGLRLGSGNPNPGRANAVRSWASNNGSKGRGAFIPDPSTGFYVQILMPMKRFL